MLLAAAIRGMPPLRDDLNITSQIISQNFKERALSLEMIVG